MAAWRPRRRARAARHGRGWLSYPRTGTNVFRVLPVKKPDGSWDTIYLDSGKNPPNGVVVQYFLPEKPAR